MRVAHFVQRYPPALGGSEAYFARLSRFLAAQGDAVSVFTSNARDLEAFWSLRGACVPSGTAVEDGVTIRRYPLWRFPGRRFLLKPLSLVPHRLWQCATLPCNPICWKMLSDAARAADAFDVVHATALPYGWPIVCGLRLARRQRIPFFITPFLHLGDPDNLRDPIRRSYTTPAFLHLLRQADAIFVQTSIERQALIEAGFPKEQIVDQGLGVDSAECTGGDRARLRHSLRVPDGEVVVGHLANNSVEKGTVDLLQAAGILWERGRRFRIVLAGPEMPNFTRFWQQFRFTDRVNGLGVLDAQQKRDFFAAIDLFALPSRSDSFGLVLLEAWANQKPNLAYRAGGIAALIRDQIDGLLVQCGDVGALAQALDRLIDDDAARQRLGHAGAQRIPHEFQWRDKLELVKRVYQQKRDERRRAPIIPKVVP